MDEAQKPEAQSNDSAQISRKSWPWIIVGMSGIILMLWNKLDEKDKLIDQKNIKIESILIQSASDQRTNTENAMELARISKEFLSLSNSYESLRDSLRRLTSDIGNNKQPTIKQSGINK